ncbi:retrovirus-related Pol polyprotein from transposon opus [Nephila pilipes]|uniref:Retrovirus-related Pol polyprotein from transposon opus n=1 Tax=Nephila pilipes TaxID=299642 RepID=A0A8X6UIV0_NEPPI|nr:retrovirus-related Pol polyprotein from transposon opus [Nephila pilipes]
MRSDSSLKFKSCTLPSRKTLWCDSSRTIIRPYIPEQFRQHIFQQIHGFSHPGIRSTIKLMMKKFIRPNMKKEVREWARTCIPCQKCKVHRHTKSKVGEYEVPDARFSVILNLVSVELKPAHLLVTDSIPDKPTFPCKQSDENSATNDSNLLSDDKPAVTRHGRQKKKPVRFQD